MIVKSSVLGKELGYSFMGGIKCLLAFFPVGRADLAVFAYELHGIHHAQGFVHRTPDRQVVDQFVAYDAVFVDQEQTPVGYHRGMGGLQVSLGIVLVFTGQYAEGRCDGFVLVGHDGIGNSSDTALLAGSLQPSPVALLGIGRGGDDLHSARFEFGEFFLKGEELRGADEGEVHRVKEEQDVFFAQELFQGISVYDFMAVYYGRLFESGGFFSYQ